MRKVISALVLNVQVLQNFTFQCTKFTYQKYLAAVFFTLFFALDSLAQVTAGYTWVSGDNKIPGMPVYGTKGVADPANILGGRIGANSWTDKNGMIWVFG